MAGTTQEVATLKSSIKLDLGDSLRKLKSFRTLLKQTKSELDKLPSRQKKLQQQVSSSPSQIKKEISAERQKAQAFASMMIEEDKLIKQNLSKRDQYKRQAQKESEQRFKDSLKTEQSGLKASNTLFADKLKQEESAFQKAERQKAEAIAARFIEEDKLIKQNLKAKQQATNESERLAKRQQRVVKEQALQSDKTRVRAKLAGIDLEGDSNSARELRRITKSFREGKIASWQYRMEVSKVIAEHRKLANSTDNAYNRFNKMRTAILAAGAAMTPFAAGSAIVETGQTMEKLGIALKVSFGQDAANQMNKFRSIVNDTGVSLTAASKSYRNFIVGAKETGFDVQEAEKIFKTFSKASVVFGMSADDTEGVFRA